ncbi:MAG: hypothetical protein GJ676_16745 [Rhodobacteraceae bacterium]|nr:hypothetical protein [Paracoccaceae bacterium]
MLVTYIRALSLMALIVKILTPALAHSQTLGSPYGKFSPGVFVEDKNNLTGIFSLAMTLQLLDSQTASFFWNEGEFDSFNFLFFSGDGFLDEGRVSREAIDSLPDEVVDIVTAQPTNTDVCYVQGFTVNDQSIVILVHDSEGGSDEHVYMCFVAAVWYFKHQNIVGFDPSAWRKEIVKLISAEVY